MEFHWINVYSPLIFFHLDVVCGVLIGILEGLILSKVWLSREGAGSIISAFGGEDPWSSS